MPGMFFMLCSIFSALSAYASVAFNCFSMSSVVSSRARRLRGVLAGARTFGSAGLPGGSGGGFVAQADKNPATQVERRARPIAADTLNLLRFALIVLMLVMFVLLRRWLRSWRSARTSTGVRRRARSASGFKLFAARFEL